MKEKMKELAKFILGIALVLGVLLSVCALCVTLYNVFLSAYNKNEASISDDAVKDTSEFAEEEISIDDKAAKEISEERIFKEEPGLVATDIFAITLPEDSTFLSETRKHGISIFDKDAKESGYGGFAFGVDLYEKASDYAGGMDKKVGEIIIDGINYDVVMSFPSEVQWDYTVSEEMPEGYAKLYDNSFDIVATMVGIDKNVIDWGAGTRGADIYKDLLSEIKSKNTDGALGFAFLDANSDGIDELFIGKVEDEKSVVTQIYTLVDKTPKKVDIGTPDSKIFVSISGFVLNEYTDKDDCFIAESYDIQPNSTDILQQVSFKIDDKNSKYYASYDDNKTWEELEKKDFDFRYNNIGNIETLYFEPFIK